MTNRIYVACLASYNNGVLHGKWIDATTDADAMQAQIDEMLRASKFPNVTVRVHCADCMGTGESFPGIKCKTCHGVGEYDAPSAEEYAIHVTEGDALASIGEFSGLAAVARCVEIEEIAEEELGSDGPSIVAAYWDNVGTMPEDAREAVEEAREQYAGSFDSWTDWAEQYIDETGLLADVPETLRNYFDYEAYGRDAKLNGDLFENNGHFFYNR